MNATELYLADGRPAKYFFCGTCGCVQKTRDEAERHCSCFTCGKPLDWSRVSQTTCDDCAADRRARILAERLANAVEAEDYEGPVFDDHAGRGDERNYYASLEDMLDDYADREDELPEWVYACHVKPFAIDLDWVIEIVSDEHHESAVYDLDGIEALQEAVDAFNAANVGVVAWSPDYKRKVRTGKAVK